MFVLLLISLYTSRILLQQLGVEDFGVYNLVGSIIALLSSIRGMFASSTQRFLNYEMGKGHLENLQVIFNISVAINLFLSIVFVVFVEAIGYWFFTYKLNIDPSRYYAAVCVFQLSVVNSVVMIMTTPFDAVIIANERMGFYACISILEGILKLAVVFLLVWWAGDKLIMYSVLLLCVSFIIRAINAVYCRRHFPESHYKMCWDERIFKNMSSFAGWNFLGNLGFSLSNEGVNMVLNIFGGPIVNAARGIAYQVRSALNLFLSNANKAIDPYSTKIYAHDDKTLFFKTMFFTSKALFSVYMCMAVPLFFNTDSVLGIWLGIIPAYSVIFIKLILIMGLMKSFFSPINLLFFSANKVKHYQMINIVMSLMIVLFSWIVLKMGFPYYSVFVVGIVVNMMSLSIYIQLAKRECNLNSFDYFIHVVLRTLCALIVGGGVSFIISSILTYSLNVIFFLRITLMVISSMIAAYLIIFNESEKLIITAIFKGFIERFCKGV